MNTLLERRDAALRSLVEWNAAEQLKEQTDRRRVPRGYAKNRFGVPAKSSEYMKLYMREKRAKNKKYGRPS